MRGQRENLPETGKLIRIRDLKDDKLDFSLDLSSVGDSELSRPFIYCISESCLLLAMRLKILKPTLFEFKGESIYKGHDIMSFKVNESTTDIAYLINELHADYVQEQLDSMRRGVAMPFIRKEDLLDVVIKFPSLGEQKAKVEGLKQAYIQAKEDKLKLEKELLGIKDDTFKEFASIKHTFRQYLGALKSNVTGTRKFLTKNEGKAISLNDIYSVKLNQTLADHLLSMDETIASLSKLLNVDSFNTIDNNVEILNLSELINGAHIRFHTDNIKFEFKVDEFSFNNGEEDLPPLIEINIEDFLRMFSNIVSNAITHGFKNSDGNIIRSSISYDDINEKCVLEVSNNGMPMPEKFTFQHLTTRGEKTTDSKGTGIGGADIKDIVIKNKGSFEIIKDATSIFQLLIKSVSQLLNNLAYEI
ncbi:MAG: GHKL domain-containing protein [Bacteroidetes bacterium]|nr:GHKL domain-containing protein [Bacteroidota bacterium]